MKRKRERDRKVAIDRYSSGEQITSMQEEVGEEIINPAPQMILLPVF